LHVFRQPYNRERERERERETDRERETEREKDEHLDSLARHLQALAQ
jgi:hypothetical protein